MQVVLERRELLTLPGDPGWTLHCVRGCLWVTRHGDLKDVVLVERQSYPIKGAAGHVVVQALEDAVLEYRFAAARGAQAHQRWWDSPARAA